MVEETPEQAFYRGGRIQILINQAGRGFVDESAARGSPGFDTTANGDAFMGTLTVAEVNGDGFPDIVIHRDNADKTPYVFLNDGNGRFAPATLDGIPATSGIYVLVAGGFQQPTRIVNVRYLWRKDPTTHRPIACSLAVQTYERPAPAAANFQGMWWAAPAGSESGWGINFAHQGDTIFATWFTFGPDGKPLWLVVGANRTGLNTYAGKLFTGTGPAFNSSPFDPTKVVSGEVGTATFTFSDNKTARFDYTVNGISQSKQITREQFGSVMPTCTSGAQRDLALATNFQDMWWAAPAASESGWGINLGHQGDTIFATWFTFGLDGKPWWLVAGAPKTGANTYSGSLYTVTGPVFSAVPFDPSKVAGTSVGIATFTFSDGNNAKFAYTVNGISQTKNITREVFAPPGTVCQ